MLINCRAKHVYGYEIIPQAIADACLNAELNGTRNATFVQGDLNKIDENFGNNFPKPDIVISGKLFVGTLTFSSFVSCNFELKVYCLGT